MVMFRGILLWCAPVLLIVGIGSCSAHDPSRPAMKGSYRASQANAYEATTEARKGNWKPEVSIPGAAKKAVMDALVGQMTSQGYSVSTANDYRLGFDKDAGAGASVLSAALLGRNLANPVWRVAFNVVEVMRDVKVTADIGMMRNPGAALQDRVDMNSGKNRDAIQSILEYVRTQTAKGARMFEVSG